MLMAIGFVDPLDHFLAPFMLEIDIDVGRLIPAFGHKAFEQHFMLDRLDRGDAEDIPNHRIGRRPPPLAVYLLAVLGSAHVCTHVTNPPSVLRISLENKNLSHIIYHTT